MKNISAFKALNNDQLNMIKGGTEVVRDCAGSGSSIPMSHGNEAGTATGTSGSGGSFPSGSGTIRGCSGGPAVPTPVLLP